MDLTQEIFLQWLVLFITVACVLALAMVRNVNVEIINRQREKLFNRILQRFWFWNGEHKIHRIDSYWYAELVKEGFELPRYDLLTDDLPTKEL